MKPLSLATLAELAGAKLIRGSGERVAFGVGIDSRTTKPGELFVAIQGPQHDGHDHLAGAATKGALAAIVSREDVGPVPAGFALLLVKDTLAALQKLARGYRLLLSTRIASITGSSGKSSTKEMLAAVLGTLGPTHRTPGNYNNHFGVPLTLLGIGEQDRWAVVEIAMNAPGEIGPLAELAGPEIGLVTNIGWAHVEGTGSKEATSREKGALYRALPENGLAVSNADDPLEKRTLEGCRARVVRVGRKEKVDYRLDSIQTDGASTRFSLQGPKGRTDVNLPVPGPHMAMNAAMAMAAGMEMGVEPRVAAEALQKVQLPSGRVRLEKLGQGWLLDDSYNANPDSLAAAIATLESLPGKGRAVALLGGMAELGSFSRMLHEDSGATIARSQTGLCFAVGTDSQFLIDAARQARPGDWARWFASREELLKAYRNEAKADDRILVKGSRSQAMDLIAAELRKGS